MSCPRFCQFSLALPFILAARSVLGQAIGKTAIGLEEVEVEYESDQFKIKNEDNGDSSKRNQSESLYEDSSYPHIEDESMCLS